MSSQNYLNEPGDPIKVPGNLDTPPPPLDDPEDFPLGPACNPLGDGTCESCQ